MLKHWKPTFVITSFNMMHRYFPLANSRKSDNHLTDTQTDSKMGRGCIIHCIYCLRHQQVISLRSSPLLYSLPLKAAHFVIQGQGIGGYGRTHPSTPHPAHIRHCLIFPSTSFSFAPLTPYLLYPQGLD